MNNLLSMLYKLFPYSAILISYTMFSLLIGESHPFTRVPMYNKFPNWAYAFYLSDEKQSLLPIKHYFHYNAGSLGHLFCGVASEFEVSYGYMQESKKDLHRIGERMMEQLKPLVFKKPEGIKVNLIRRSFFITRDKLESRDDMIFSMNTNQLDNDKTGYHE